MPERDIRKYLKARVEEYGGEVRAVAWLGRNNAPDVLAMFPFDALVKGKARRHVFIETKAPGGVPTEAQFREHVRMRNAGCDVLVLSTEAQVDAWLPSKGNHA